MSSVEVDMREFEQMVERLAQVPTSLKRPLEAGYRVYEGEVKKLLAAPGSGRWYGKHQASAPGEAPAVLTGNLLNNWPEPAFGFTSTSASIEGGPSAEYAEDLEFGTSEVEARPYMRPAAFENLAKISQAITSTLARLIEELLS